MPLEWTAELLVCSAWLAYASQTRWKHAPPGTLETWQCWAQHPPPGEGEQIIIEAPAQLVNPVSPSDGNLRFTVCR